MLKKRMTARITAILMTSVMAVSFMPQIAFGAETEIDEEMIVEEEMIDEEIVDEEISEEEEAPEDIEGVPQVDGEVVASSDDPAELADMSMDEAVGEDYANRIMVLTDEDIENSEGAENAFYNENHEAFILEYDSEEATANAEATLEEQFGEGNVIRDVPVTLDASYDSWGTAVMGLNTLKTKANAASLNSTTVAVIDTGINKSHTLFKGRISSKSRGFGVSSYADIHGHGSNVAGIVASETSKQVKIMALRVMNNNGGLSFLDVMDAVEYAANNGAKVVNMSLGAEDAPAALKAYGDDILKAAHDKGVIVIASAGNSHRNVSTNYPASSKYTIAVSAMDQNKKKASFSNYGAGVDFTAPGVAVAGAGRTGTTSSLTMSGTSQAAPSLAGAAAMVKLYHPGYSYSNVYKVLKENAIDLGSKGKDTSFGWGYVKIGSPTETAIGGQAKLNAMTPAKTSVKKLTGGKKCFTVQWTKKSVTGYQVRYATNKAMKSAKVKKVTSAGATKLTVKSLSAKKVYYVQVRTYKKTGSTTHYSAWTPVKVVKTK